MCFRTKLQSLREDIPALSECIYLNTGGSGPTPKVVLDEIINSYKYIYENGAIVVPVVDKVKSGAEKGRKMLAELVGVNPEEVAFLRSVAEGINILAHTFEWSPGDEVIITNQENPANILPWYPLVKSKGVKVKKLNLENDKKVILSRLEELISPRTRLISASHVTHVSGLLLPVKEMSAIAHKYGVPIMLDGAQAVGQVPVDLKDIGCDFYFIIGHKWLMGPDGTAAMYINKKHLKEIEPPFIGVGSQRSFDFEKDTFVLKDDAKKFEFGGRPWPLYRALGRAAEYIKDIGVVEIQKRSKKLATLFRKLLEEVPEAKLISPTEDELITGIVTFKVEGCDAIQLVRRYWESDNILVQWRRLNLLKDDKGIRVSIGWFTQEEELEKVVYCLKRYLKG